MPKKKPAGKAVAAPTAVTIEVPVAPIEDGYLTRHVEAQLDEPERRALRGLFNGLVAADERLANGRPIERMSHAIRWLLQQVAENTDGEGG